MVTLIFKFDPRKGQLQVKVGQIGSNFKIQNFRTKACLSCAYLSQNSKNVIYFYVRQLKMPKMHFKNVTSSSLSVFFWPLRSQNKDIALNFCMGVVCVYLDHIDFGFSDNLKISDFISNYL